MTRQPTATSGSPAGASGMNALPTAGEQHRADRHRPDAPAPGRPGRDHRADERRGATDPGHDAEHGRARAASSSRTNRNQVAPKMPHSAGERHLGADERPQDRVVTDEPEPVPDLGQDRLAILRLGGGGASGRRIVPSSSADAR